MGRTMTAESPDQGKIPEPLLPVPLAIVRCTML